MQKRIRKKKVDTIRFVIIGGGVAAVACAQQIAKLSSNDVTNPIEITLISASKLLKETFVSRVVTEHLQEIEICENEVSFFQSLNPSIRVIIGSVTRLDTSNKVAILSDETTIPYDKLCICTGSVPHLISNHPRVIGIRDLDSISNLIEYLKTAKSVAIVGNGGIALEIIHNLPFCNVEWIIRDSNIGSTFFDDYSSRFLIPSIYTRMKLSEVKNSSCLNINTSQLPASSSSSSSSSSTQSKQSKHNISGSKGAALGPEWLKASGLLNSIPVESTHCNGYIQLHCDQEVSKVTNSDKDDDDGHELTLITSLGKRIQCDFVISATGVTSKPCLTFAGPEFILHGDEGTLLVNSSLSTSVVDVYAAGDCCRYTHGLLDRYNVDDEDGEVFRSDCDNVHASHWFQMKLWTQARQQGQYAGQCMYQSSVNQISNLPFRFKTPITVPATATATTASSMDIREIELEFEMQNFFFELFTHITRFLGYKIVLLGRFNGQGLSSELINVIEQHRLRGETNNSSTGKSFSSNNQKSDIAKIVGGREDMKEGILRFIVTKDGLLQVLNNTKPTELPYNASGLELWFRVRFEIDLVKLVLYHGRLIGVTLIGDTDLEETFENLILNKIDLSQYGPEMLCAENDIEDYFD